jgi:hypothetical protein
VTFVAIPVIKNSKVVELSIRFDRPMSMQILKTLIQKISSELDHTQQEGVHVHNFISFPVYCNGEMIATISKCSCGKSIRQNL